MLDNFFFSWPQSTELRNFLQDWWNNSCRSETINQTQLSALSKV